MKVYLQVNKENVITDAITYPHENYVEHVVDSLPTGICGGWFKHENGTIVEYPELKPMNKDEEIEQLKSKINLMQSALDELIFGGGF